MMIVIGVLSIITLISVAYTIILQLQLRNINRQLTKRLNEQTRQPVSLELINKELNTLAVNINECLKVEELLSIDSLKEEKRFKELIANISHDLRTPLTAIHGYQQLMEKDQLTENQRVRLGTAQKYVAVLEGLIEHFFEYSYIVTAELKLNMVRINLTNLVAECLAESVTTFEERGLTVNFVGQPLFIMADKEMTLRVIHNLIRNCAVHSVGDVDVCVSATENAVVSFRNPVDVAAKIDVEQLFERFYTGDQARSKTTGLGLHIVRLLSEQMGGAAGAVVEDGVIEVWVKLPLCKKPN